MHRVGSCLLAAALLSAASAASANSRFPSANQLVVHPGDPSTITVRTTFGLLISRDRGGTFHWVCEDAVGKTSGTDPGIAVFADGSEAVAGFLGLAITHDRACSFPFVGGDLLNQYAVDVSANKSNFDAGVMLTATQQPGDLAYIQVFQTSDNAATWTKLGTAIDPTLIATTLDVAPSDPNTIYVGAGEVSNDARRGVVLSSTDGGQGWARGVIPNTPAAYISGIDPSDAKRVYVRDYTQTRDSLYVSIDGGLTFVNVLTIDGPMGGFALSPDGSKVAVGGSVRGVFIADRTANPADMKFEQRATDPVTCLTWTADEIYSCGIAQPGTFVLARSTDEARTWQPIMNDFTGVIGPDTACASDTPVRTVCDPQWPATQCGLTRTCVSDAGLDGSGSDDGGIPPKTTGAQDPGCGCRLPGATPPGSLGKTWLIGLAALCAGLAGRAIRRKRSARGPRSVRP